MLVHVPPGVNGPAYRVRCGVRLLFGAAASRELLGWAGGLYHKPDICCNRLATVLHPEQEKG